MDLSSWFRSYRDTNHDELYSLVAKRLKTSDEVNNNDLISLTESKLVTIQSPESRIRITAASKALTSDLDKLGPNYYRRQNHLTCCGIATLATGWDLFHNNNNDNSLSMDDNNYKKTSEGDIFKISKTLNEENVKRKGMTLEDIFTASMELFGGETRQLFSYDITIERPECIEELRNFLIDYFKAIFTDNNNNNGLLICNYDMKLAGQGDWWGGHISPIAAYDARSDSVLILDVWKYTDPFWISIDTLLASTVLSIDSGSQTSRGFVKIIQTQK